MPHRSCLYTHTHTYICIPRGPVHRVCTLHIYAHALTPGSTHPYQPPPTVTSCLPATRPYQEAGADPTHTAYLSSIRFTQFHPMCNFCKHHHIQDTKLFVAYSALCYSWSGFQCCHRGPWALTALSGWQNTLRSFMVGSPRRWRSECFRSDTESGDHP